MRIIVLKGPSNKGKTTTIDLVYEIILRHGGKSTEKQQIGNPIFKDFKDIVTDYKYKKIAFFSMGDYSNELVNAINNYNKEKCDLLICALSTDTEKVRADEVLNNFKITQINKTVVNQKDLECRANVMDSLIILGLV